MTQTENDKEKKSITMIDNYALIDVVGTGQNTTWKALDVNTKKVCALKEFKHTFQAMNEKQKQEQESECLTLDEMDSLLGDKCTRLFKENSYSRAGVKTTVSELGVIPVRRDVPQIVMEQQPRQDLFQLLNNTKKSFDEASARIAFKMLGEPIWLLHDNGWAHRDIKLENTVIDKEGRLRLADFGQTIKGRGTSSVGTLAYRAPELMRPNSDYDAQKADMWALGVLFFTLVRGSFPWVQATMDDKFFKLVAEQNWSLFWRVHEKHSRKTFSDAFKSLIQGMLKVDPMERLDMTGVAESDMLKDEEEECLVDIGPDLAKDHSHNEFELKRAFTNPASDKLRCTQPEINALTLLIKSRTDSYVKR